MMVSDYLKNIITKKFYFYCVIVFLIKVVFSVLFSSQINDDLFYPFVNNFINGEYNIWDFYFNNSLNLEAFPYHPTLLYILSIPTFFIELLNIENYFLTNLIFKSPLLVFDFLIFLLLIKEFSKQKEKVLFFYFLNPIIFYATFMHSQLDIIPTFFILASVFALKKYRVLTSSILFGLAISCKIHVLILLPLILFYIFKRTNVKNTIIFFFSCLIIFLLIDLPFLFSEGFYNMVLFNEKQSEIFHSIMNFGSISIVMPVFCIAIIYYDIISKEKINFNLLVFYIGILFCVFIALTKPSPAWLVWFIPFSCIYYVKSYNLRKSFIISFILSLSYLFYNILFYKSKYIDILFLGTPFQFKIDNPITHNISFTIFQVSLIIVLIVFYKYGVNTNKFYYDKNITIGISGDSASGKTSLVNLLKNIFGDNILHLEGDGEHKWERLDSNWKTITHLNPKANFLHKQVNYIKKLKAKQKIYRNDYDHNTGKFILNKKYYSKDFIALSGLHTLYLPSLRDVLDLKIFLDPDQEIRKKWKVDRDVNDRGYKKEDVINSFNKRLEDGIKYIDPQKIHADIIISFISLNNLNGDISSNLDVLGLKFDIDVNIDIIEVLEKTEINFKHKYNDDLITQEVLFEEEPSFNFKKYLHQNIDEYEFLPANFSVENGFKGLIQFICIILIQKKIIHEI